MRTKNSRTWRPSRPYTLEEFNASSATSLSLQGISCCQLLSCSSKVSDQPSLRPEAQVLRAEASTSRRAAPQPHPSLPQLPPRPGWTNTGKRIECGDVQAWCSVRVPDDMANRLIAFYLEIDHPILGQFDPELFIEDMLDLRTDFCSRLLVTSVLLWACVRLLLDQKLSFRSLTAPNSTDIVSSINVLTR